MAHITEYIAEGDEDYFAAHLANGWARIGIAGAPCFAVDVPPGHPSFAMIVEAAPDPGGPYIIDQELSDALVEVASRSASSRRSTMTDELKPRGEG